MPDALDLALANAASNMPKGEELHLRNLDSIADPTSDTYQYDAKADNRDIGPSYISQPLSAASQETACPTSNEPALTGDPFVDFAKGQTFTLGEARQKLFPRISTEQTQQPLPRPVLDYQQMMEAEYAEKATANNATTSGIHHLSVLTQAISDKTNWIQQHLIDLTMQVSRIEATITTAAQSMSQKPSHNHRSLHEWDDTQLLNELVERENDLMPFYYELLKRIGSPELQSLVMSSMQGKNASMVTLAQLCSALAPTPQQPRSVYEVGLSPSAEQRMDEAFHAATTPQTYTQAQLDNLRLNGQSSGITVEEIALYEKMKRNSSPSYPATIPSMPPTYNPFFKEQ